MVRRLPVVQSGAATPRGETRGGPFRAAVLILCLWAPALALGDGGRLGWGWAAWFTVAAGLSDLILAPGMQSGASRRAPGSWAGGRSALPVFFASAVAAVATIAATGAIAAAVWGGVALFVSGMIGVLANRAVRRLGAAASKRLTGV